MAPAPSTRNDSALITDAKVGLSDDASARTRRYLMSMAVRVVCFVTGCLSPSPWNWVLFACAAIIPPIAVVLANAIDQRGASSLPSEAADQARLALTPGTVIPGSVED